MFCLAELGKISEFLEWGGGLFFLIFNLAWKKAKVTDLNQFVYLVTDWHTHGILKRMNNLPFDLQFSLEKRKKLKSSTNFFCISKEIFIFRPILKERNSCW